jgi:hypothetical protein
MSQGTTIYYSVTVVYHIPIQNDSFIFQSAKEAAGGKRLHGYIHTTPKLSLIHTLGEPYRFVIGN